MSPDPGAILVGFGLALAILLVGFGLGARARSSRPKPGRMGMWEDVAKRLGGKLFVTESGDLRVRFRWNGREAALHGGSSAMLTIEGCDLQKLHMVLDLRHRRLSNLKAVDRAFFSPTVEKLLEDLAGVGGRKVEVDRRIRVAGSEAESAQQLVRFTVLSLQLAQHAKLFAEKDDGVQVVDAKASSSGECQICGASLEGMLVRCARCATPHHADCWEYTGTCSTYGCGEKSFLP